MAALAAAGAAPSSLPQEAFAVEARVKARMATKATTAAITAPVWLRMRMRSGSALAWRAFGPGDESSAHGLAASTALVQCLDGVRA